MPFIHRLYCFTFVKDADFQSLFLIIKRIIIIIILKITSNNYFSRKRLLLCIFGAIMQKKSMKIFSINCVFRIHKMVASYQISLSKMHCWTLLIGTIYESLFSKKVYEAKSRHCWRNTRIWGCSLSVSSLGESTPHSQETSLILADLCEWGTERG